MALIILLSFGSCYCMEGNIKKAELLSFLREFLQSENITVIDDTDPNNRIIKTGKSATDDAQSLLSQITGKQIKIKTITSGSFNMTITVKKPENQDSTE